MSPNGTVPMRTGEMAVIGYALAEPPSKLKAGLVAAVLFVLVIVGIACLPSKGKRRP